MVLGQAEMTQIRRVTQLLLGLLIVSSTLIACAGSGLRPAVLSLPPLLQAEGYLSPEQALEMTPQLDPLQLNDAVRGMLDRHIDLEASAQSRVEQLTRLIMSEAFIGMDYQPSLTSTALDVVRTGEGNCLGFSHLFIAMARYAGLDAQYQQLDVKPQWNRQGRWLLVERHINVHGRLSRKRAYTADVDRQMRYHTMHARTLSDEEGLALHYNNMAMEALLSGARQQAWGLLLRGLQASPKQDALWLNLGTLYKTNQQLQAAKSSYDVALQLNPHSVVAMQHLQRIHHRLGDQEQSARYAEQLDKARAINPYYQAWRAHLAAESGDWSVATDAIAQAIELKPSEFDFHAAATGYYLGAGRDELARASLQQARTLARGEQEKLLGLLESRFDQGQPWSAFNELTSPPGR